MMQHSTGLLSYHVLLQAMKVNVFMFLLAASHAKPSLPSPSPLPPPHPSPTTKSWPCLDTMMVVVKDEISSTRKNRLSKSSQGSASGFYGSGSSSYLKVDLDPDPWPYK